MTEFKTGTVVRLKSGSPKMTVKGRDGGTLDGEGENIIWAVQWIDRNGKLQSDSFHEDMLDIFVPKARDDHGAKPRRDKNRDPKFY
jgi:uncharacterized protein YodC (DUF2158 family)